MIKKIGWYRHETVAGEFYTYQAKSVSHYVPIGPGDRKPNSQELAAFANEYPNASIDYMAQVGCHYEHKVAAQDSVDLPPGCYTHKDANPMTSEPERLCPANLREDVYLKIPSIYEPVAEDIRSFIENEAVYRDVGTIYKRGILLYGPPGEGKTSFVRAIIKNEIPNDAVVLFFEQMPSNDLIKHLKDSLGDRLKVIIFEELANLLENTRIERVLDFLDGEKSLDRCLIFGTTNYPERLPGNIVDRPSRFDFLHRFAIKTNAERTVLLTHFLKREPVGDELKAVDKMSAAQIKEVAMLTFLRKISVEDAAKRLKNHSELVKKDFAESRKLGLGRGGDDWND